MIITTTHPFDSSRVLTPMVTGILPVCKPVVARGQVYCGNDFRQRAVAWFMAEKTRAADADSFVAVAEVAVAQEKIVTKVDTGKKTKRSTTPTRVQPARAAKRKAVDPGENNSSDSKDSIAPPKKRLRIILTKAPAVVRTPIPTTSYTLSSVYTNATPSQFQAGLDIVLDTKQAALTSGCHWSTSLYLSPSPSVSPTVTLDLSGSSSSSSCSCSSSSLLSKTSGYSTPRSAWCPIVAEPLACVDRAYCLHSIGRLTPEPMSCSEKMTTTSTLSRPPAPEAAMLPPWTPPPEIVLNTRAKEFAEMRHVQERTVEFGGLRFAVDVCDGSVRVWMV
ncbi:hypothetical protein F503_01715 [Ophiostoma piceae UAMH 11346]|uniref:Uncharacterized protein n=1 Tax=Ophiostoma piceae (strain UAMH 11346) TaxID=1262450 RepID=S3CT10_OPHP1|nr:hypothetical protein F503_01715 [Ophiostoma piceae UAMH 11346]